MPFSSGSGTRSIPENSPIIATISAPDIYSSIVADGDARGKGQSSASIDQCVAVAVQHVGQALDQGELTNFRQWANAYLLRRIEANVYATLIVIVYHQAANAQADARQREAAFFFPRDPRFS